MDCIRFTENLPQYLAGKLDAIEFELMVDHEIGCDACRQLAAAQMQDSDAGWLEVSQNSQDDWLTETLEKTLGADCQYIEIKLAQQIDGEEIDEMTERHLSDCQRCRALGEVLADLPSYYQAFPRLKVDRRFLPEVVQSTVGRMPGMLDVLRALLKRPEALVEGAIACALIAAPFAGDLPTKMLARINHTPQAVIEHAHIENISTNLNHRITTANDHLSSVTANRRAVIKHEFNAAQQWAHQRYDYITSTDPETGSPTAKAWQWTERALSRAGLIEVDKPVDANKRNTDSPESPSGTDK